MDEVVWGEEAPERVRLHGHRQLALPSDDVTRSARRKAPRGWLRWIRPTRGESDMARSSCFRTTATNAVDLAPIDVFQWTSESAFSTQRSGVLEGNNDVPFLVADDRLIIRTAGRMDGDGSRAARERDDSHLGSYGVQRGVGGRSCRCGARGRCGRDVCFLLHRSANLGILLLVLRYKQVARLYMCGDLGRLPLQSLCVFLELSDLGFAPCDLPVE